MANPRKFSEKIALHNQKQAEETAAFERIMQEVSVTRVIHPGVHPQATPRHLSPHSQPFLRPYHLGGSLPNVNQIASPPLQDFTARMGGFEDSKQHMRHYPRIDTRMRPYLPRRPGIEPSRNKPPDNMPGSYNIGPYLSPPGDSNWRSFALSRTNSDSALHQSARIPNSSQESFNQPHFTTGQPNHHMRRDFQDPVHKTIMENQKHVDFRTKSCDGPKINLIGDPDMNNPHRNTLSSPPSLHRPPNPSAVSTLTHVTQIGNNTGSLPDLSNLHMPSPLSTPIDYDEQSQSQNQHNPSSLLYGARSTGNLPAASSINPHIPPGMTPRGVGASNQSRPRRHTHNGPGPSPLSLTSPNHNRRMKFSGMKTEMKSPTGLPYAYPYPVHSLSVHSPQHNQDSRGPTSMNPPHSTIVAPNPLRVDVSAATSFVTPHTLSQHRNHRQSSGANVTSPITSPTSPTSQHSQSPGQSPQHLPELTSSSNPALSEAYYNRSEYPLQPLQRQFEHFNMISDVTTTSSGAMNSNQTTDSHSTVSHSNVLNYSTRPMFSQNSRIPDIVFTDVDQNHGSDGTGGVLTMMENPSNLPEYQNDYFPGDEFRVSLGLEELEMLGQNNIEDPVMEDQLHLDSL